MRTELVIIPATELHAYELAPSMREEDAAEVMASHGYTPLEALLASMRVSEGPRTVLVDGVVAGIFGVAPMQVEPCSGSIWLLGSQLLTRHRIAFLRLCRREVRRLLEQHAFLFNFVDARYSAALRWAKWLGFQVGEPTPFGVERKQFHFISIHLEDPCAHPQPSL